MIVVPSQFKGNAFCDKKFKELIQFFNELEEKLSYPNSEGIADQIRELERAQTELIKLGIL
jgi:hypothetical protein